MEIQFNTINIIPDLTEYDQTVLYKHFYQWERKYGKNSKFFAFVNVLWYGLSDAKKPENEEEFAFPQNFTLETLIEIMNLSDHLWTNHLEGKRDFFPPPSSTNVNGRAFRSVPAYRALMYFRDTEDVCHNLIGYEPKKTTKSGVYVEGPRWYVSGWDDLIAETNRTHSFITLQDVTHLNLLG